MMRRTMTKARAPMARFLRGNDGVAAVEFALIAPLLVVFLLGTTMATQSLWAHGKVSQRRLRLDFDEVLVVIDFE